MKCSQKLHPLGMILNANMFSQLKHKIITLLLYFCTTEKCGRRVGMCEGTEQSIDAW